MLPTVVIGRPVGGVKGATGGGDPMFMSFDSNRIGLGCGDQKFIYDIPTGQVLGRKTLAENAPQVSPSGKLGWLAF